MFRPGNLTPQDASTLNAAMRQIAALQAMSVASPLSITRAGGVASISLNPVFLQWVILGEVTAVTSGDHTVKRLTWDGAAIADYDPLTEYESCRSTTGSDLTVGDVVMVYPIPDVSGNYWITPADGGGGGGGSITVDTVDGTPSYTGITTLRLDEADGFVLTNPSAGVARVDIAAATPTQAGVVSTTTQSFAGDKTFIDDVIADTFRTTHGYAGGLGWDVDSLGDARFQQDIYVTKVVRAGQGNVGNVSATTSIFALDYGGRALEVESGTLGDRTTKVYGADYGLVSLTPVLQAEDPGSPLGFFNVGGTARCFALQVWREYYTGSNLTQAAQNFSFVWSSGKFQGNTNTLTGFEYDTSTLIWKFNGVAFETDTKFRCNGNDGITVTTAGATFTGGILTAGTISAPVNSGGSTNLTGVVRGNGSTLSGAELSGDVTTSGSNATTIANNAVTTAKINNGAVTEAKITLADNTTNNVTSAAHGFAPKSPADVTQFLNGAATPAFAAVKDSDLSTSDITTNNATAAKHGFLKKLSNVATEYMDGTGNWSTPASGADKTCGLRLTCSSSDPWGESTGSATLYALPAVSGTVWLYTSSVWTLYTVSSASISVAATTDNTNYDVFMYDSGGTPTLELVAWTNATTRATALTTQNGIYVKSGDASRRYLGTIRTDDGETQDYYEFRWVWNMYNRCRRHMYSVDGTNSWTYTSTTWRQANGGVSPNQFGYVQGLATDAISAEVLAYSSTTNTSSNVGVGIGIDSTSVNSATVFGGKATNATGTLWVSNAKYIGSPGIGYHILTWLEQSTAAGTTTWYGDAGTTQYQSGITGEGWF